MIRDLPLYEEFEKAADAGRITRHVRGNLVGFKYTTETVYAGDWDLVTLNSRGIVFDKTTGGVVAFPFRKFFNYEELRSGGDVTELYGKLAQYDAFVPTFEGSFRCMDKLDGSLGIVFCYQGEWIVKTGGAFNSEQAIWANEWFKHNVNTNKMYEQNTYLFEILAPWDEHPIKYDRSGMELLGVVNNMDGTEYNTDYIVLTAEAIGVRHAVIYDFKTLDEVIPFAKRLPRDKEGVVVTYPSGFKVKIKGEEFLILQKLFHGITKKYLWFSYNPFEEKFYAHLDKHNGWLPVDDVPLFIPEEMSETRKYVDDQMEELHVRLDNCIGNARTILSQCDSQRTAFEFARANYSDWSAIMMIVNAAMSGKDVNYGSVRKEIWKAMKPTTEFKWIDNAEEG